jgi:hypothetical protein
LEPWLVENFFVVYFDGVKEVEFTTRKGTDERYVFITFKDEDSWNKSLTKDRLQIMRKMFVIDKEHYEIMADRDALETVMWFTQMSNTAEEATKQYMELNQVSAQEPERVIELIKKESKKEE